MRSYGKGNLMVGRKLLILGIILICSGLPRLTNDSFSEEFRQEGWPVPDLNGITPYSITIRMVDGAEVIVERFYTPNGGHIARISGNGKIFAYGVDRDKIPPMDYLLLDPDGTGRFSKKLRPDERYLIPEWVLH